MIKVESCGVVPFVRENGQWKVLVILHREGNHWGFPKGRVDLPESPQETAKRELKEETGLDILELLTAEPITEQYQFRKKDHIVVKRVSYFPALVGGELKPQEEEIRDAKWLTIEAALQQLSYKEARHILREFVRILNIPLSS